MLYDTIELDKLLEKLEGPYKKKDLITMFDIERAFMRLRAAAILHMNTDRPESIKYRKRYASWAEELASKIEVELKLYTDGDGEDYRISYYNTAALLIREALISLRHFYIKESRFEIDWSK